MSMCHFGIAASFLLLASSSCATTGSSVASTTSATGSKMVDRQESINEIATAVCMRYKECNGFGEGKKYASQNDCEIQQRDDFNNRWPEQECATTGLDRQKFVECRERVKQYQCSSNVFDLGAIMVECTASKLCG